MYTGYELVDPRDDLPFYVGITDDVYRRFREHSRGNSKNFAMNARVQELHMEQEIMIMRPLFRAKTYHESLELEIEWIDKYIQQGLKLLNIVSVESPVIVFKTPDIVGGKLKLYDGKGKFHKRNTGAQIDEILDWYLLTGELPDVSARQLYSYRHHPRLEDRRKLLKQVKIEG